MASFLTPAYLRIAGPSTSHTTFENTSITIDKIQYEKNENFFKNLLGKRKRQAPSRLKITNFQWREFIKWANVTGFDIVFALNNDEKTSSGLWDPSSALTALTLAKKANIENIVWQLGYECNNKTIDEYLNDLETVRVLMETVQGGGRAGGPRWRAAGGDVTRCLTQPGDFNDYITLAIDMADVLMLNGNSTTQELDEMSERDRLKLLTSLQRSSTPLWITDSPLWTGEMERAADWMASLGYSARNGFSVHFRELMTEELYEPTLSFYMALLYKNLVGERVLPVQFNTLQTTVFAHCTSLRQKAVPRAVTLYGVNMEQKPTRLAVKLTPREDVNGRAMTNEGDIRPILKRVRPYKTLLINLPAKSFGFWVLSNTNIAACQDIDDSDKKFVQAENINLDDIEIEKKTVRRKRFTTIDDFNDEFLEADLGDLDNSIDTVQLKDMIKNLNEELRSAQHFFKRHTSRVRRQVNDQIKGTRKARRQLITYKKDNKYDDVESKPILNLLGTLLQLTRKNNTRFLRKPMKLHRRKTGSRYHYDRLQNEEFVENNKGIRNKRNIIGDQFQRRYKSEEDSTKENEIDIENNRDRYRESKKIRNILNGIQKQMQNMPPDASDNDTKDKSKINEKVIIKTELTDDSATINFSETPGHGVIKTTFENLFSVLAELNKNINKFCEERSHVVTAPAGAGAGIGHLTGPVPDCRRYLVEDVKLTEFG
ncbi:unnamed protein product [Diatraea saccharalis]|uniref:Heparanase n=1 Tax=Diatraea saccharalis TaxID=40085 RepID=A0A9N9RDL2_9NEOP|nr:unnamed protein product [Diatraea saccharalis]